MEHEDSIFRLLDGEFLSFMDISLLDDRAIQKVLREVDQMELAKALKNSEREVQNKIFRNMSKRAAAMLPQDYAKAAEWLEKAASQGDSEMSYRLAARYEEGRGLNRDEAKARVWLEKSATQGNKEAAQKLAEYCEKGGDFKRASDLYEQAGDAESALRCLKSVS